MKLKVHCALVVLCILPAAALAQGNAGKHDAKTLDHTSADATDHKGKADHHADHKDSPRAHEARSRTQAETDQAPGALHETTSVIHPPGFATGPSSNDNVE
jgi:hypothetical protein